MPAIDTKRLTFAEYLLLPTIMQRYDIIDGEMIMSAAPTMRHQWISRNILLALESYFRSNRRGIVIYAPCDIVIRRDPLRTRQPDLFLFLRGRSDVSDLQSLLDRPVLEVAPDITIEIFENLRGDRLIRHAGVGLQRRHAPAPCRSTVDICLVACYKRSICYPSTGAMDFVRVRVTGLSELLNHTEVQHGRDHGCGVLSLACNDPTG